MTKTLDYADHDEGDLKRKFSRPSPEEGHRLVRLFLSVERADLREEIFNFVEGILRRQNRDQSIQPPRAVSSRKLLIERHRRAGSSSQGCERTSAPAGIGSPPVGERQHPAFVVAAGEDQQTGPPGAGAISFAVLEGETQHARR